MRPTAQSQRGEGFTTAIGKRIPNLGGRTASGRTEPGAKSGTAVGMRYSVADVTNALDSVSQICDTGATVTFTRTGGYIRRPSGEKTEFRRVDDTYVRDVWIPVSRLGGSSTFSRQTQS